MAKDRITPCLYYVCKGECKKGRKSDHNGYCQRCDKYKPRVRERHKNLKKREVGKDTEERHALISLDILANM